MSVESVMLCNQFMIYSSLPLLPSIFPNNRVFSSVLTLHTRLSKYWNISCSISSSKEQSRFFFFFRIYWFHFLAVQGILKSLLKHSILKASVFQCSAFFMFQLSHSYMTIGKSIALTIWTFFVKVMSLLFNMLSTF